MEPSTLDTLQAIQKDISLCDLSDPLGRSYALALIHRLESKMNRYNSVQKAMSRLSSEQFAIETPEEKESFDEMEKRLGPERMAELDAQLLRECREIEAAHPQTFGPIIDGILDTVRPK